MEKELIDKANEIIRLIDKNERAIEKLSKYADCGTELYSRSYCYKDDAGIHVSQEPIDFEDWEIRLMIHHKKQRINALKVQLERL